jgi:hypothetical protein
MRRSFAVSGIGLMMWACAGHADVVVTTPPQPLSAGGYWASYSSPPGFGSPVYGTQGFYLDLNGDGQQDVQAGDFLYVEMGRLNGWTTSFAPLRVRLVEETVPLSRGTGSQQVVAPLGPNSVIGPGSAFGTSAAVEQQYFGFAPQPLPSYSAPGWTTGVNYIGFSMTNTAGATNYGWIQARLGGRVLPPVLPPPGQWGSTPGGITVERWAIETTPNTSIITPAPEPASAAMLLVAAPALLWSRSGGRPTHGPNGRPGRA